MGEADPAIIVDGHTHITNRVYWEAIDPWEPQPFGFDFARAFDAGVNVVIENVAPYGYGNFNRTPKQTLRLIETFHRLIERQSDKMALALTGEDVRRVVSSGRLAVVLGIESGFDHEGDLDVLRALYRLVLRVVQFATQTCFNAIADCEIGGPPTWNGVSPQGRALIEEMNTLGILIDLTHATPLAQAQAITASEAPVVISHTTVASVSGAGVSDELLASLAAKGGMIGVIGASAAVSASYRAWLQANPTTAQEALAPVMSMIAFEADHTPAALDHGEFGVWMDEQLRARHLAAFRPWVELAGSEAVVPTSTDWAAHVEHVVQTVGADHVGIGLDLVGGRSCVPADASGYPQLVTALRAVLDPEAVNKVAGMNWMRIFDAIFRA
jgi:membrane dipeptidase